MPIEAAAGIQADYSATRDIALEERASALVNPKSGLANDYLNVFNELVMLIEQLPAMPELIDDISAWRPISYQDYFAKSNLPGRAVALENYERLAADMREQFEALVAELDRNATGAVAAIRVFFRRSKGGESEGLEALCAKTSAALHVILSRASALVDYGTAQAEESAQLRTDRLLAVRIHSLRDVMAFQNR